MPAVPKGIEQPGRFYHNVMAVVTSDWHLSERRPPARAESDWLSVQKNFLIQLRELQAMYSCPILVAGDIFDRPEPSPWIINFALAYMPKVFAVPGNHDMIFNNYREIDKTAYWTLIEANKVTNLTPGVDHELDSTCGSQLRIRGFPSGIEVKPRESKNWLGLDVAVIHDYIWTKNTGHIHAPETKRFHQWADKLSGYDIAVFGDNHKGFIGTKLNNCQVINCGTLIRRKSDEINYKPSVGLIHSNGTITRHFLDTSEDEFVDEAVKIEELESALKIDLSGFIDQLAASRKLGLDWNKAIKLYCDKHKIKPEVADLMIKASKRLK